MSRYSVPAIVIDNGSGICKAGFAGDGDPRVVFPTIVGRIWDMHLNSYRCYTGVEADYVRDELTLSYPLEHGVFIDWVDMKKIWQYVFNELKISAEEHPVLLTEPHLNPKSNREKMVQVMFENFNTPATFIKIPSILSLYASGRTTGLVLTSGAGATHAVSIKDSSAIPDSIQRASYGGRTLTEGLVKMMNRRGYKFTNDTEREIVRNIKENRCYVAVDFYDEVQKSQGTSFQSKSYQLPDGKLVNIGSEMFRCPETLFQPPSGYEGVHQLIHNSILKVDPEKRQTMYSNIVLEGGNTLLPGFSERVKYEVQTLAPSGMRVKVMAPPDRKFSAWIGGSVLASLSTFQDKWITKQEYEECGPGIVHEKC